MELFGVALTSLLLSVAGLINTFRVFGSLSVEWPGKDGKHPRCPPKGNMPKGNSEHGRVTFFPCYVTARMLGWYSCMLVTGWYRAPGVMSCLHLGLHLGCRALAPQTQHPHPSVAGLDRTVGWENPLWRCFWSPMYGCGSRTAADLTAGMCSWADILCKQELVTG